MSFECPSCGFRNSEVQSAGEIQPRGVKYSLRLESPDDFQRQIVKSDTATIRIEEVDLEVPPGRGRLSDLEGVFSEIKEDLEQDQPVRKYQHPQLHDKLEAIISKLGTMIAGNSFPCTVVLDDMAGNSSLEPSARDGAGKYRRQEYNRSPEQNVSLGLAPGVRGEEDLSVVAQTNSRSPKEISTEDVEIMDGETYTMPCDCPGCAKSAAMNMQMVNIPYFKQVLISAVVCLHCGYKTSEVKTGGEVPRQGRKIWLDVRNTQDLRRDILKAETCCLSIPECSVEVQPGTMGGRFTTVEGLLTQIRDDLRSSIFDTSNDDGKGGDSMPADQKEGWGRFFAVLDKAISAEMPYTILLQDPMANSYVQSYTAPEPDPQLRTEDYDRTEEEEEDLGLQDMRTHLNEHGEYIRDTQEA